MSVAGLTATPAGTREYGAAKQARMGFFTDTSVCIGCKACEVACKEWNLIPEDGLVWTGESYDNTSTLGANSWRHVAFIEQTKPLRVGNGRVQGSEHRPRPEETEGRTGSGPAGRAERDTGVPEGRLKGSDPGTRPPMPIDAIRTDGETAELNGNGDGLRWLMSSDVCKHCTEAACLDVCPTGALFRTEFETVVVQEDVCNGCGYCVPACPFGVLDKRHLPTAEPQRATLPHPFGKKEDGRVWKCTLCYDRLKGGHEPACAKACPTDSIQFGPLDELRERADARLAKLEREGWKGARLYGRDPSDGVGGFGAFFLLLDEPEVYGLPPDPLVSTRFLGEMWKAAAVAMGALTLGVVGAFAGGRR